MDVVKAVQTYLARLVAEVPGMKVLLLDAHTVRHPPPLAHADSPVGTDAHRVARHDPDGAARARDIPDGPVRKVRLALPSSPDALPTDKRPHDRHSQTRQPLNHLHCIAFVRPTRQNIAHIRSELAQPRYGSYWLCERRSLRSHPCWPKTPHAR